jgi:ketosteroid isomerase-like protein
MRSGVPAKKLKTYVIEAEEVALFLSRWTLRAASGNPDARSQTFVATTVFREHPDGKWKIRSENFQKAAAIHRRETSALVSAGFKIFFRRLRFTTNQTPHSR